MKNGIHLTSMLFSLWCKTAAAAVDLKAIEINEWTRRSNFQLKLASEYCNYIGYVLILQ
ncbi:hypothetical protein Tsp_13465 [Trichinella spiralis]|uniref:hypothetical protein n=1 Tax=Trichinella spiralis TaxID=6334 RepID=UPI0001EFEB84|nr:hypothetical protein Tsp_13465 [Trichinella spiralis]